MTKEPASSDHTSKTEKRRSIRSKVVICAIVLVLLVCFFCLILFVWNNVSTASDAAFAKRLDTAIERSERWIEEHKEEILNKRNAALVTMLLESNELEANASFDHIVRSFMEESDPYAEGASWVRQVDPNWPIYERSLNQTIDGVDIDYKWMLYALAPDKARITPEEMHLFDPQRWQGRQLTHQLYALDLLRRTGGANRELNKLIEHLSDRITGELVWDVAVVDIYIQKVVFVLRADFPKKIRRRWIERIIANQQPDGGWNDRWFCFTSYRRPRFDFKAPPSDQHATVQAAAALYLVRYRYPEHFGLK